MPEHRGRVRGSNRDRYHHDDDYSDHSDYDRPSRSATAPPKRHRSISRRALDRLSSTFGNLGLNKDKDVRPRSTGRHREGGHGDDSDYDTDYSTNYTHTNNNNNNNNNNNHNKKRSSRSRHHSPDRNHDRGSGTRSSRYPPRANLNRQRSYSYSPERYESTRRGRSSHRSGTGYSGRDPRSRSRWGRSIDAALDAAAIEAIRVRKEPGPWTGRKGSRVLTAAMAAAAVGAATDHRKANGDGRKDTKGKIGSALGGLVINRMLNGPKRDLKRDLRY